MYQPNLNVAQATGNGAVNLPHTNGMVNSGYAVPQPPPSQAGVAQNLPVHPDVRLKKLAFFDVMATLLKPSTLLPTSTTQRMQEGTYYFHLTPQQATDIASNRYAHRRCIIGPTANKCFLINAISFISHTEISGIARKLNTSYKFSCGFVC